MVVSLWVVMRGFLGASSSSSISQRAGDGCDGLQEEPLPSIPIALSSTSSSSPASSSVSSFIIIISFISTRMSMCMNTSVSIRGNIALVTEPSRPLSSIHLQSRLKTIDINTDNEDDVKKNTRMM